VEAPTRFSTISSSNLKTIWKFWKSFQPRHDPGNCLLRSYFVPASKISTDLEQPYNRPFFRVVLLDKQKDQRSFMEMMLKAFLIRHVPFRHHPGVFPAQLSFWLLHIVTGLHSRVNRSPFSVGTLSANDRIEQKGGYAQFSRASSETFLRSKPSLTAFSLNALS
jgi:hypothetical protein